MRVWQARPTYTIRPEPIYCTDSVANAPTHTSSTTPDSKSPALRYTVQFSSRIAAPPADLHWEPCASLCRTRHPTFAPASSLSRSLLKHNAAPPLRGKRNVRVLSLTPLPGTASPPAQSARSAPGPAAASATPSPVAPAADAPRHPPASSPPAPVQPPGPPGAASLVCR